MHCLMHCVLYLTSSCPLYPEQTRFIKHVSPAGTLPQPMTDAHYKAVLTFFLPFNHQSLGFFPPCTLYLDI